MPASIYDPTTCRMVIFGGANVVAGLVMLNDTWVLTTGAGPTCDVIPVDIDIKPGSDRNSTNIGSHGVIRVAILAAAGFDATTVDPVTVDFEGASAVRSALKDVDHDRDMDLIMHFQTQDTNIADEAVEACLTGETFGGQPIEGCDAIRIVPPH